MPCSEHWPTRPGFVFNRERLLKIARPEPEAVDNEAHRRRSREAVAVRAVNARCGPNIRPVSEKRLRALDPSKCKI
jgi:hypothetical protein